MDNPNKTEIFKAQGIGRKKIPGMVIIAEKEVPDYIGIDWQKHWKEFYTKEAKQLYRALKKSLPQGTIDHLFAIIAKEKASILMIS